MWSWSLAPALPPLTQHCPEQWVRTLPWLKGALAVVFRGVSVLQTVTWGLTVQGPPQLPAEPRVPAVVSHSGRD